MLLIFFIISIFPLVSPTTIFVGQLFEYNIGKATKICHPTWMVLNEKTLRGIPGEHDVGIHTILGKSCCDFRITVNVIHEEKTTCYPKPTYWVEAQFSGPPTLANKIENLFAVAEAAEEPIEALRVYDHPYSTQNRVLEEIGQYEKFGTYIVMWPAACGQNLDMFLASEVMADFLQTDVPFYSLFMANGHYKPVKDKHHVRRWSFDDHICVKPTMYWWEKVVHFFIN